MFVEFVICIKIKINRLNGIFRRKLILHVSEIETMKRGFEFTEKAKLVKVNSN